MGIPSTSVKLKIAIASYPFTTPLKSGEIPIDGIEPEFAEVVPFIGAYRRMVRDLEFDICEVAPTTYMIARALGAPIIALPIILQRAFHHDSIVCRPDSGIKVPKDLEGKKVGVRAYSVTTGVWTRGIYTNEYDMDASKVTWVVDDEEAVLGLELPPNVIHTPPGKSLVSLMAEGGIQAGFTANAGLGREGPPQAGWEGKTAPKPPAEPYYHLLSNGAAVAAEWYHRTGIYPLHGVLVVKEAVLAAHPWIARSLLDAFNRAKQPFLRDLKSGQGTSPLLTKYRNVMPVVGDDPIPYGMAANAKSIEALMTYAYQQRLIPTPSSVSEMFLDPENM